MQQVRISRSKIPLRLIKIKRPK